MATFRNRHGKSQARVARKEIKPISKSFQNKQDAERSARQVEADIDKGGYTNVALAECRLLKDIFQRYIQEVTNQTRSTKFRGRKPNGFEKIDLDDPDQLLKAIELSMPNVSK